MGRLIDANDLLTVTDIRADGTEFTYVSYGTIEEAPTVLTIPDNPTNGQMQLVLYPELEVRDFGSFVEAHSPNVELRVSKSWWNTPYKRGTEDGQSSSNTED